MIRAVLIDLDDTLLQNDMRRFLPEYFARLGEHLASFAPPEVIVQEVMAGSLAMVRNTDPTQTLEGVFADHFFQAIDVQAPSMQSSIHAFYTDVFPTLRSLTSPIPNAEAFVRGLVNANNYEVVIATSPLFPRTATQQRLDWAGLPMDQIGYSLVTTYEEFHFSKPHAAYYAEVLGRLGVPASDAAMIGNDPDDDITPAQSLGMAVYHVDPAPVVPAGGGIEGAASWLTKLGGQKATPRILRTEALLSLLEGYLAALIGLTNILEAELWRKRPSEHVWSANEIVSHLRDVEREVNLPRIDKILTLTEPHISALDTDAWAVERNYHAQSGPASLDAFIEARLLTLAKLRELDPKDWDRSARHSIFGPTTLSELVKIITDHDLMHLAQVRQVLQFLEEGSP